MQVTLGLNMRLVMTCRSHSKNLVMQVFQNLHGYPCLFDPLDPCIILDEDIWLPYPHVNSLDAIAEFQNPLYASGTSTQSLVTRLQGGIKHRILGQCIPNKVFRMSNGLIMPSRDLYEAALFSMRIPWVSWHFTR